MSTMMEAGMRDLATQERKRWRCGAWVASWASASRHREARIAASTVASLSAESVAKVRSVRKAVVASRKVSCLTAVDPGSLRVVRRHFETLPGSTQDEG